MNSNVARDDVGEGKYNKEKQVFVLTVQVSWWALTMTVSGGSSGSLEKTASLQHILSFTTRL